MRVPGLLLALTLLAPAVGAQPVQVRPTLFSGDTGVVAYGFDNFATGPDGDFYTANRYAPTRGVYRYDGETGALIGLFVPDGSGGLDSPASPVFGPDGRLYVGSLFSDEILRYDGETGAFIDVFVPDTESDPSTMAFGPDGHLYVPRPPRIGKQPSIVRYDGETGTFLGVFATPLGPSP